MAVNNQDLLDTINNWANELNTTGKHYQFAFLEIFIELEKFLSNSFIQYSLGHEGKNGYKPDLRLQFLTEEQFTGLLKGDAQYIDYVKKIKTIREHIFLNDTCPFEKVFSTSEFNTAFNQMLLIRNLIAHQSEEAKFRYHNKVLKANGINNYIKVETFLKRVNQSKGLPYYSIYVDIVKFYTEILCDPN